MRLLAGASLFLDFDGTLVAIAERPDAVTVSDRLRRTLSRLHDRLGGRVAIVSGRSAGQIIDLFGTSPFAIAGSHGQELRRPDGSIETAERPEELEPARQEMAKLATEWPGVLLEEKPLGAALHYRGCPEAEQACRELATDLAAMHGLHLQTGKMVVELRALDGDKGTALRRLMSEPPMAGNTPLFIGDDDTDEPAFRAAAELGGAGIRVGRPATTSAGYLLPDVAAVLDWLDRACPA
jgi:trehalose 6-phosphate phosphatase